MGVQERVSRSAGPVGSRRHGLRHSAGRSPDLRSTKAVASSSAAPSPLDRGLAEPTLTYGPLDAEAPAEGLVLLLHGAGDSAEGMMGLAQEWASKMPRVAFLMPSAPVRATHSAWFGRVKGKLQCANFDTITLQLLKLLQTERRRLGLPMSQVAIWGYSAGSLMAGWLAMQLREHCAALVLLHGLAPDKRLPPPPKAPPGPRPPTLCLAGESDVQIPPPAVEKAVRDLQSNGFQDVIYHLESGGTHAISDFEMRMMGDFLRKHLQSTKTSNQQPIEGII